MKLNLVRRSFMLLAVVAITGCASGPAFQKADSVPADKALVYVYRPSGMQGAALVPFIVVNEENAIGLKNGGYYATTVKPGPTVVAINHTGRRTAEFDAKAGETYYLKGGMVFMGFGVPYIELTAADIGAKEIAETKLLVQDAPATAANAPK